MTTRREFITGLISFAVTAPAIVRAASLMPVKAMEEVLFTSSEWPIYNEASIMTLKDLHAYWQRLAAYRASPAKWIDL